MDIAIIFAAIGAVAAVVGTVVNWLDRRDRKTPPPTQHERVCAVVAVARPTAPPDYLIGNGGAERIGFNRNR